MDLFSTFIHFSAILATNLWVSSNRCKFRSHPKFIKLFYCITPTTQKKIHFLLFETRSCMELKDTIDNFVFFPNVTISTIAPFKYWHCLYTRYVNLRRDRLKEFSSFNLKLVIGPRSPHWILIHLQWNVENSELLKKQNWIYILIYS